MWAFLNFHLRSVADIMDDDFVRNTVEFFLIQNEAIPLSTIVVNWKAFHGHNILCFNRFLEVK